MRSIACFFIIIILMCSAYAKPGSDQHYPATTVDLIITADTKAATANQTLNISFVISNTREYDATNIEIYPDLSDIIEWPRKKLEIGNKVNTSQDGYGHQLSSNFDKDIQIDDHAYIYKDGKIEIQIGHLRKGDCVVINYTTSLVDDAVCDTKKICLPIDFNNGFRWTKETDKRDPKIHEITKIKDTISTDLKIIVQPLCNITASNATSCTILEGTKLSFVASNIETDLSDLAIDDYIMESGTPNKIYNNSGMNKLGNHKFSARLDLPRHTINLKNDTVFHVVRLAEYHKEQIKSNEFILFIVFSIIISISLIEFLRWRRKSFDKWYIVSLLALIALAYLICIYHYPINDAYYQDMIPLESVSLSIAFLILIYYYHCIDEKPDWMIAIIQAIGMLVFFVYFHYYMPELLSNKFSIIALSALGLIVAGIIAAKKQDEFENPFDKYKCNKDKIIRIAAIIIITIYAIVAPIYANIESGVIFSLKFDIKDLMIIISSELMPLIAIAISGMSYKTAKEMALELLGKKLEDKKNK